MLEINLGGHYAREVYTVRGTFHTVYASPTPAYCGGIFAYSDELGEIGQLRLYDNADEFIAALRRLKVAAVVAKLHEACLPIAPFLPPFDDVVPDTRYTDECYICHAIGIGQPTCCEVLGGIPDDDADRLYPTLFALCVRVSYNMREGSDDDTDTALVAATRVTEVGLAAAFSETTGLDPQHIVGGDEYIIFGDALLEEDEEED